MTKAPALPADKPLPLYSLVHPPNPDAGEIGRIPIPHDYALGETMKPISEMSIEEFVEKFRGRYVTNPAWTQEKGQPAVYFITGSTETTAYGTVGASCLAVNDKGDLTSEGIIVPKHLKEMSETDAFGTPIKEANQLKCVDVSTLGLGSKEEI